MEEIDSSITIRIIIIIVNLPSSYTLNIQNIAPILKREPATLFILKLELKTP
jgi:hypothetical protein